MSDINNGTPPAAGAEDPTKNLKAEFQRKFDNMTAEVAKQRELSEQLLARIAALPTTEKKQEREPDLSDLIYSDPKRYSEIMEERAEARIMKKLEGQQRNANVLNQLMNEYPETGDQDHPLTKRAVEIYNGLPSDEKTSPAAYRAAVAEAAAEMGVKPRSKRPADEEYTMGAGSSGSRRRSKGDSEKADPATLGFAAAVGLDISDPELVKRLAKRAQRTWTKYEKVGK